MMIKAKPGLNLFDKLVLFFTYLLALALLVSYLAPYTNPKTFWPIAFFGLAYVPLIAVNGMLLLFWLLRQKKYLFIPLVAMVLGYRMFFNSFGFYSGSSASAPKASPKYIRVMSYNVHGFKSMLPDDKSPARHQILQLIKSQQPDIISFQEFFTTKNGGFDMVDSLKAILKTKSYYFQSLYNNFGGGFKGLAIFTKLPITGHGLIKLSEGNNDNQAIFIDVTSKGKTFRLYCVHLQSIHFEHEDYRYLDSVSRKGQTNMAKSKRIGSKLKAAFIKRSEQVEIVKAHVAQCPYPYIISGDFNDTPSSYAVNQMSKGLTNAFAEKGWGLGKTYNGDFPNFQIDYIMASPQFKVINYTVIAKKLSDHYPVRSDVQ